MQIKENLSLLGIKDKVLSASSIETYAYCPYRWLMEYGLRPQDPSLAFDARITGILAHRCLQILYARIMEEDPKGRIDQENLAYWLLELDELIAKNLKKWLEEELESRAFDEEDQENLDRIARNLRAFLRHDANLLPGFKPYALEYRIEGEYAGRRFKGFIDRIDVKDNLYVIRDYKLGSADCVSLNQKDGKGEHKIQAVLYAQLFQRSKQEVLEAQLKNSDARISDARVCACLYQSLNNPKAIGGCFDADILDYSALGISNIKAKNCGLPMEQKWDPKYLKRQPDDFQDYLQLVEDFVGEQIAHLEQGKFPKIKNDKGAYCIIQPVCGICDEGGF